jgi:hypothetical protein
MRVRCSQIPDVIVLTSHRHVIRDVSAFALLVLIAIGIVGTSRGEKTALGVVSNRAASAVPTIYYDL